MSVGNRKRAIADATRAYFRVRCRSRGVQSPRAVKTSDRGCKRLNRARQSCVLTLKDRVATVKAPVCGGNGPGFGLDDVPPARTVLRTTEMAPSGAANGRVSDEPHHVDGNGVAFLHDRLKPRFRHRLDEALDAL